MHRIVVLALDGVIPFELGIPARIFDSAVGPAGDKLYEVLTCSIGGDRVRTASDFTVCVPHGEDALSTANTVVIPATHNDSASYNHGYLAEELTSALALVRPGTRLVSICTGAFVLAAAGMLDGRVATTHWRLAEDFRSVYPTVTVDPDVLFVDDGDVLTSAGAASGIDLCLHIVRKDHGTEVANDVARRCVVPPWREGGQAQYIVRPVPASGGTSTAPTRAWALEQLDSNLSLARLAHHARMSTRTFTRRFHNETGLSPAAWINQQRVGYARHLLESSDLSIDAIAAQSGLGTGAALRQNMRSTLGIAPNTYRRTFRGTKTGAGVSAGK